MEMSHTSTLLAVITELTLFVHIARDNDFTFTEDSQFLTLDDGLDVSGQVREHRIIRSCFPYHAKDPKAGVKCNICRTLYAVNGHQKPIFHSSQKQALRMRVMRREKDVRIDMITIAIHVHETQKVNVELSRSETVEGTSRPLKSVDDVKCSHCLALRMLSVGDRVTDDL